MKFVAGLFAALVATSACNKPGLKEEAEQGAEPHLAEAPSQVQRPLPVAPLASPVAATELMKLCEASCELAQSAHCSRQAECLPQCKSLFGGGVCQEAMKQMLECMAHSQPTDWECGPGGTPNLRDGNCEQEQSGAFECLQVQKP